MSEPFVEQTPGVGDLAGAVEPDTQLVHVGAGENALADGVGDVDLPPPEVTQNGLRPTDRTRGWWEQYRGRLPASFLDIAELEHHATHRRDVESLNIPGLLQTEAYAHAVFSYRVPELPHTDTELRVEHRMRRRAVIEGPAAIPYEAVIHEAALRIRVGDRAAARAQLTRVLEISDADHVTVRVVPFDLDSFAGAWSTMMYAGGALPKLDTVVRDAPHGTGFVDSEAQLAAFRTLFRKVEAASLDPERSRDLIHRLAKEL
ncbi:DUF5753 domain-containing protein [Streptomyces sp. 3214.6]|uniref:DUF5753 domain-containing protein n=1 Tax=Streptomyces sp. 3214.6 TaxID=1882757 RepID=UPI00090B3DAC|nr:DUF5753 domain-containing protein [Streptomyces sp. 3214.6]SHI20395.1 hypothetical protein SAMN05444521_5335 [Streptomyces sp. 3214.6]